MSDLVETTLQDSQHAVLPLVAPPISEEYVAREREFEGVSVDDNVLAKFPPGTRVISANRFGKAAWSSSARLILELPGGVQEQYKMKTAAGDNGRLLMEGEFAAMSELYKTSPDFVPKPHSWGKFRSEEKYFFLAHFIQMRDRMPNPDKLCPKLAELHEKSVSPTGKFGFHVPTCQGRTAQAVSWESSWTEFFRKLLKHVTDLDFKANGYWERLDILEQRTFESVIPKLIGALEAEGRSVKPCLIHANLWEGNTGTSIETGEVYIFDASAYYGHNEMEIADWRCDYNKIHRPVYTETYLQECFGKPSLSSEPADHWDDRNRMYSVYYNIIYSVNHGIGGQAIRQTAFDDLYYLIDKYAPFPEEVFEMVLEFDGQR
ncbi:Fructosamine kinase-domain-containing protein [Phyllosticta capitalensis]|uniref:Fructosamine kinase-domain-containing protein n=1 Tax=Phyllosticta capitalensis TaxID=121624 RepID=UPI00312E1A4E